MRSFPTCRRRQLLRQASDASGSPPARALWPWALLVAMARHGAARGPIQQRSATPPHFRSVWRPSHLRPGPAPVALSHPMCPTPRRKGPPAIHQNSGGIMPPPAPQGSRDARARAHRLVHGRHAGAGALRRRRARPAPRPPGRPRLHSGDRHRVKWPGEPLLYLAGWGGRLCPTWRSRRSSPSPPGHAPPPAADDDARRPKPRRHRLPGAAELISSPGGVGA
jgi:hypothetical protein